MPYRLAVFDFDGTLADSFPWFLGVLNGVARRHGFREVDRAAAEALRAHGTRRILRELGVPLRRLPAIVRDVRALKARCAGDIPLYEGVPELLRDLAGGGARVAVVSSDGENSVRRTLGAGAAGRVAYFACGASLFGKAPKIRRVLRAAGVLPADAIAIGDETRDAEAAAEAEVAFGAVAWGYALPETLRARRPDHFFSRVGDIAPVVLGDGGTERRAGP